MPARPHKRSLLLTLVVAALTLALAGFAAPAQAAPAPHPHGHHKHGHHKHGHHHQHRNHQHRHHAHGTRPATTHSTGGGQAGGGLAGRAEHVALRQVGDPYRYGATGPGSFDCSGLVYYSYRSAGKRNVARTSSAQARQAHHIGRHSMQPGDLMFFTGGGGVYHVAIFTGWRHGQATMVHSPRPGERVQRSVPWTNSWFAGTFR